MIGECLPLDQTAVVCLTAIIIAAMTLYGFVRWVEGKGQ
jgi:hypothetical protein